MVGSCRQGGKAYGFLPLSPLNPPDIVVFTSFETQVGSRFVVLMWKGSHARDERPLFWGTGKQRDTIRHFSTAKKKHSEMEVKELDTNYRLLCKGDLNMDVTYLLLIFLFQLCPLVDYRLP